MDEIWEAPAKINLSLLVRPPDASGNHPIRSLVQTIEWCDELELHSSDDDHLQVEGADLPTGQGNLVWKGVDALGERRPRLHMVLRKSIPVGAGLGGGSSDAAAAISAVGGLLSLEHGQLSDAAAATGADVPFFLTGGTAWIEGYGERVGPVSALGGFAVAVVVPPFELSTAEVYRRWDALGGPEGPTVAGSSVPPALRTEGPIRNDLTPAAISLRPELGDWIAELTSAWGRSAMMSGSGSALFGLFGDRDEAAEAARVRPSRAAVGADLRSAGVTRADR